MSKSFKIFLWVVAAYFVLIVIPLVYADGGVSIHEFWRHLGAAPISILGAAYAVVSNQRRNAERKSTAVSRMAAEIRAKREASRDDSVRELSRQRVTVVKEIAQSSPEPSGTDD